MRDVPKYWIQLPPHLVGGVIPGRPHIQRQLGQRIESFRVDP